MRDRPISPVHFALIVIVLMTMAVFIIVKTVFVSFRTPRLEPESQTPRKVKSVRKATG